MTYAYSFTDHFILFFPFVFLPHSHPVTEPIANTVAIDTIGRLARITTKYIQIDLIRLPSRTLISQS